MSVSKEDIKAILDEHEARRVKTETLQHAAVLVPLFMKDGQWHVLFTKRASHLPTHPGEVAFPGGALDEGEKAVEAALREAEEEVGIRPEDVEVLGRLDDTFTLTRYRVSPFVGVIPYPYAFDVSEYEIADVFDVSLSTLTDPATFRRSNSSMGGRHYPLYFFDGGKYTIWGVTGRILMHFLELVFNWQEPGE